MLDANAENDISLRRELLRMVLRDTLKHTGVPQQWIGGEATPFTDEEGRLTIEVRLILECEEPRFHYYLAAFQSEFEARLLAIEPRAWDWVSRISWSLSSHRKDNDPDFVMPSPDYWEEVQHDRQLTARQKGRLEWGQEDLARHFEDTHPGEGDFENTHPPVLDEGDVLPSRY